METVNQENEAKTFTQEELDKIVGERLSRDRAKYADYEELKLKAEQLDKITEANKSELQKATERAEALQNELNGLKKANEIRNVRDKVAGETGVPAALLTGETEEECEAQAKSILEFARPTGYPRVKDEGEPRKTSKKPTRDQFADWINAQTKNI